MKTVFWLSLIATCYTYIGYPLVMWAWTRLRPSPWNAATINPRISVVLAVHNGMSLLAAKVQHLLELDYPNIEEIIIVSDGSTDGTAEWLALQHFPKVHAIVLKEHGGKAVAVNAGIQAATGEIILFVDIRPEIAPGSIQQLVSNFADRKVGCASGNLKLRMDDHDGASTAISGFYWRYEQWIRTCEAAIDSPVGVYGGFYAIRRELAVPQPQGLILDDMFQPLSIIRQGYRSVVDEKAFVYDTWPKNAQGEFHRKVRTLAGNFQLIQVAPWLLTFQNRLLFQFISHKLMRLVIPYLLVLMLISAMVLAGHSVLYAGFALVQLLGWAIALIGLSERAVVLPKIASPAAALLVLNAAAVVGFYKFLFTRGPLWKIWNAGKAQTAQSTLASDNHVPREFSGKSS